MAFEAQGTRLFWSASTSLSTAVQIGEVNSINGPSGSAGVIDVTHLGSTAKEKLMGLPDEGQVTFDVNLDNADAGQIALRNDRASRSKKRVAIKFNDAATSLWHIEAYCTGFAISGAVDDKVTASVTCELTGPLTFTTA